MKNLIFVLGFLLIPSVSSAAALTNDQATSLINVVQVSTSTPASAFVPLITAFSNITIPQAESLINVVQQAPGVPANSFVAMLLAFTVDPVVQTPILGSTQTIQPTIDNTPKQTTPVVQSPNMEGVSILDLGHNGDYRSIKIIVKDAQGKIFDNAKETVRISVDGQLVKAGTAGEDQHPVYDIELNQVGGKVYNFSAISTSKIEVIYKGIVYTL